MNDEIKEILNKWKCYIELTKKFTTNEYEMLRVEDIDKILDYITNLQQEIEKLNDDKRGMLVQLYKANDNRDKVKQENERLKEDYAKIVNDNCDYLKLEQENEIRQQDINNLTYQLAKIKEENERLKEEILNKEIAQEKAILKIIGLYSYADNEEYVDNYCKDLLNILQNGSENK